MSKQMKNLNSVIGEWDFLLPLYRRSNEPCARSEDSLFFAPIALLRTFVLIMKKQLIQR